MPESGEFMYSKAITSISVTYNVSFITIKNLPDNIQAISDVFNSIKEENINIDMISQMPLSGRFINISFSVLSEDMVKTLVALNNHKKRMPDLNIEVNSGNTKISVFGDAMKVVPGVAAKLFSVLAKNNIEIKMVTTSEVEISFLLYANYVDKAVSAIKKEFEL